MIMMIIRADSTLMLSHPTLRDWLLASPQGRRPPHKFSVNPRPGHAAIALSLARAGASRGLGHGDTLQLAHHLLKVDIWAFYSLISHLTLLRRDCTAGAGARAGLLPGTCRRCCSPWPRRT